MVSLIAIVQRLAKLLVNKPSFVALTSLVVVGLPLNSQSPVLSPNTTGKGCHGLHAGVTAQFNSHTEEPTIQLSFVLLNDSDQPLDSGPGSWMIVIDGKNLEDSDMIFGNGVGPVGGFRTLEPGHTYEFGKALPVVRYFPERKGYTVSWKGNGFTSPIIKIRGGLPQ